MPGKMYTVGYGGFNHATGSGPAGWLLWSGSFSFTGSGDGNTETIYSGSGFEIVSGSENFIRFATTPSQFEVRTDQFIIGRSGSGAAESFISGSGANIEISSSNFHLQPDGSVIMQGTITADAGNIGGFTITDTAIASSDLNLVLSGSGVITASAGIIGGLEISSTALKKGTSYTISSSTDTADPVGFISSSKFKVSPGGDVTGSNVLFEGGVIGGLTITDTSLQGSTFLISSSTQTIDPVGFISSSFFKVSPVGVITGSDVLFSGGTIAGWTIDNEKFTGDKMIIRKDGTIESDGFASNVAGSGFRLTAASGGFLEVENARIRGTLSTATFEKETVNAVGGQLYVANSTTLTGSGQLASDVAQPGTHRDTDTTMSVVNVTGFAVGEIVTAKKITNSGFSTEYMLVESTSRDNGTSENDFTGKIHVQRGIGTPGNGNVSGSLGDTPGGAATYSGSQVIVSTGKIGTGYIRLNANPNDVTTPYIDIVERTGSGLYDVELKARLGDLSGVADNQFGSLTGQFGLYTDNVFLKGVISASAGNLGGFNIGATALSAGTSFNLSSSVNGADPVSFISSSNFKVSATGRVTGSSILLGDKSTQQFLEFEGGTMTVAGSVTADSIRTPALIGGVASTETNASSSIKADGFATFKSASIGGFQIKESEITSGITLRMKSNGDFTGSRVHLIGGKIGGWTVDGHSLRTTGVEFNASGFGANSNLFISSSKFKVDHSGNITGSSIILDKDAQARALRAIPITITTTNIANFASKSNNDTNKKTIDLYLDGSVTNGVVGSPGANPERVTQHAILDLDLDSGNSSGYDRPIYRVIPPALDGESLPFVLQVVGGHDVRLAAFENDTSGFSSTVAYAAEAPVSPATVF